MPSSKGEGQALWVPPHPAACSPPWAVSTPRLAPGSPQTAAFPKLRWLASPAHSTSIYWATAVCQIPCWALGHHG